VPTSPDISFEVHVEGSPRPFSCRKGHSVLSAMIARCGRGLAVGCKSGGCGVCRVQVLRGAYRTGLMSVSEVPADHQQQGIALACQIYPESDLSVRALGRLYHK